MEEEHNAPSAQQLAELEQLRLEKRQRQLTEHAQSALAARGISGEFAAFLLGEDETATGRNIASFEKSYQAALSAEVARRLPQQQPRDFAAAPTRNRRCGIRKV